MYTVEEIYTIYIIYKNVHILKLRYANEGTRINVLRLWFYLYVVGLLAVSFKVILQFISKKIGKMLTIGPFHNPPKTCSSLDGGRELGFTETQFYSCLSTMANNEL